MTNREPVNIMGVFAFPNPDKDKREIRFIDSEYHTLFTIQDGEGIVITRFDGERMVFPCKYIDDYHVCVGNSAYETGSRGRGSPHSECLPAAAPPCARPP